jgi:long-chain acyl-CoA synthetase
MLSQINPNAIAISIEDKSYTYKELESLIKKETKELHKILFIEAAASIEFISKVFAAIEMKTPVIIIPKEFKDEESLRQKISMNSLHEDCALVLLTSGSSGQSKAVQLSLKNIKTNINAISKSLNFNQIESQVLFLPLSYSFGLIGQLFTALSLGKRTYLADHFIKVKKIVEKENIHMISGVPSHFSNLIKLLDQNNSLTHIVSAGAFLSPSLRKKLVDSFPKAVVYNNYGQTEMGPRALCLSSDDESFLTNATGYPVEGIEYLIENGFIKFRGEQIMLGYLGEDSPINDEGWLETGDQAIESNGLITIQGRVDDLIKVDGNKVSLVQLKETILSLTNQSEIALVSSKEDELFCFITNEISREQHRDLLSSLKINIPFNHFVLLPSILKLNNGKVDNVSLREMILERKLKNDSRTD